MRKSNLTEYRKSKREAVSFDDSSELGARDAVYLSLVETKNTENYTEENVFDEARSLHVHDLKEQSIKANPKEQNITEYLDDEEDINRNKPSKKPVPPPTLPKPTTLPRHFKPSDFGGGVFVFPQVDASSKQTDTSPEHVGASSQATDTSSNQVVTSSVQEDTSQSMDKHRPAIWIDKTKDNEDTSEDTSQDKYKTLPLNPLEQDGKPVISPKPHRKSDGFEHKKSQFEKSPSSDPQQLGAFRQIHAKLKATLSMSTPILGSGGGDGCQTLDVADSGRSSYRSVCSEGSVRSDRDSGKLFIEYKLFIGYTAVVCFPIIDIYFWQGVGAFLD